MLKKQFSTGLSKLDQYIGALQPGDSFLTFIPSRAALQEILTTIVAYAVEARIPLTYLSADEFLIDSFPAGSRFNHFESGHGKQRPNSLLNAVKRFASSHCKNSIIILDDLSKWKELLGSDRRALELFAFLSALSIKKKSVLIGTAVRSAFNLAQLADIKDTATICLDLIVHEEELYLLPLVLKGRYIPRGLFPLRLRISDLRKQAPAQTEPEHTVSEAQINKVHADIFYSDEKYQKTFQEASEAMMLFDIGGEFREINHRAESLIGYSPDEIKAANPFSFVAVQDRFRALRCIVELRRKKKASVQLELVTKNGKTIPVEIHSSNISDGLYVAFVRDIGERRKIEHQFRQKEQEYKVLVDHSLFGTLIVHDHKPLFVNKAFYAAFAYQLVEDSTFKNIKQLLTPESHRRYQKLIRDGTIANAHQHVELQVLRKDGSIADCDVTVSEIPFGGKTCTQLSFVDVTNQKQFIQKITSAEQRLRMLVDHAREAVAVINNGRFEFANRTFLNMFGFGLPDEIAGKEITEIVEESEREQVKAATQKRSSQKNSPASFQFSRLQKDNTRIDIEMAVTPVQTDGIALTLAFFRDITEQKRAAQELHQRLEDVKLLDEIISVLNSTVELQRIIHVMLHKLMEKFSWEMGAVFLVDEKGEGLSVAYHRNLSEKIIAKLGSLNLDEGIGGFMAKTQEPHLFTLKKYPSYLPFRAVFNEAGIANVCFLPLVSKEKLVGMVLLGSKKEIRQTTISMDLLRSIVRQAGTAIARAQWSQALTESEERLQQLIESASDVLYIAAPDGSFKQVNSSIEQLTGYAPKEFYRNPSLWLRLVHPDDKKILLERTTNLNESSERLVNEYRILPKGKAAYRWVRDAISIVKDTSGAVNGIHGTIYDLTLHKQLTDDLRISNELKTNILTSITEGVVVYDPALNCVQWNQAMEKITGLKQSDVVGKPHPEIFAKTDMKGIDDLLQRAFAGEEVSSDDIRYHIPQTSKQGYLWGRYSPLRNSNGDVIGIVGVIAEVSERKKLESDLRESEQVLRNVIDTMDDVLVLTDLKGVVLQVNRTFLKVLGYTRSEAVGADFPYPWLVEDQMGRYVLWLASLREKNWLHDFDMTWKAKDERLIPMSLSTTFLRNSLGEPIAILNIARDITERTRLGKDLENRNRQIEHLNRIVTEANQTLNFEEIFETIAREIKEIVPCDEISVGLLSEDGTGINVYARVGSISLPKGTTIPIENTVSQFVIQQQKPVLISDFQLEDRYRKFVAYREGLRSQISLPISLKGRTFGTLNIASREPHTFTDEHCLVLEPIVQQIGAIIDRVQLFNQVTEDATYIHNLLDSIDSVVYTVDAQHRIREVNRAWYEIIHESGKPRESDYLGMNLFDVLPSDSLKIIIQNVIDQLLNGTVRFFSEEFVHDIPGGQRIFQLTINPMIIDRKITGLVFTHTDITTLKNTEAELKKNNEQLLALNEISTIISTSIELKEILETAIPLLRNTLETGAVAIYLLEKGTNDLVLTTQLGFEDRQLASILRLHQGASATGEVVKTKDALYISDKAYLDERIMIVNREILRHSKLNAMAVIPLVSKDKVLGALDIFYHDAHEFSSSERQMLTLVGNQLGAAIENAELYAELRSQVDRLTVLYEVSQQLTSTLDIDQMFQVVFEKIQNVILAEKFNVELYDAKQKLKTPTFCVHVVQGEAIAVPKVSTPRLIDTESPEWRVISSKHSYQNPERTSMYVPMLSKETIIGIMSIEGTSEQKYTEIHLRLLESIANLTAIALEKGKLYEETMQKSLEIQRRNKELDDFTYVVSHDLKEPLISIEGFSKILQADYEGIIQGEGKEYLDSIVGATARMKGLIDDLLMLSRVSRPSEAFKVISLEGVIDDIKTDMEFTIRQKGVKFVVPEKLPDVYGNEIQLTIVLRNLIGNAVKFNNKPNPVVEIGFRNAENNSYLFSIKDNGIGIDKEFHEKVFVIFQRLHRREEYEGTGAGLAIVKKIIELHKGKIWLESELGEGSTFFFTIPKAYTNEER